MPRPTKQRTSLPGHSKAATREISKDQDSLPALPAFSNNPFETNLEIADPPTIVRPPTKQTKSDKAYQKRSALLAKITEGTNPYSKSHNRRLRKAERPSEHLVTSLDTVVDVLAEMDELKAEENVVESVSSKVKVDAGKGKEKLTGKKRQRVLVEEAMRLPSVMANPAFSTDPFATIRLHTLNTMQRFELTPKPKKK